MGRKKRPNRWLKNEQNTKANTATVCTQAISNGRPGVNDRTDDYQKFYKNNIVFSISFSFFWFLVSLFHNLFFSWFLFRRIVFVVVVVVFYFFFSFVFLTSAKRANKQVNTRSHAHAHTRPNWIDQAKNLQLDRPANPKRSTIKFAWIGEKFKRLQNIFMLFYGTSYLTLCMHMYLYLFRSFSGVKLIKNYG